MTDFMIILVILTLFLLLDTMAKLSLYTLLLMLLYIKHATLFCHLDDC